MMVTARPHGAGGDRLLREGARLVHVAVVERRGVDVFANRLRPGCVPGDGAADSQQPQRAARRRREHRVDDVHEHLLVLRNSGRPDQRRVVGVVRLPRLLGNLVPQVPVRHVVWLRMAARRAECT